MDQDEFKDVQSIDSMARMLEAIWTMLSSPGQQDISPLLSGLDTSGRLGDIMDSLVDLRELSSALSKGDLNKLVYSRGYVLSNLKALQSNLRHLTWQTKKIANGDFTHKVDFLGEFSESFNEMTLKLHSYSESLQALATIDPLTQIPNRRYLDQFLSTCFARFLRDNEPFCILLIDLDFFKLINDTYGHDVGDQVLIQVSRFMYSQFRACDVLTRFGGEEFMAVLSNTRESVALDIAYRLVGRVAKTPIRINGLTIGLTVSVGVSEVLTDDENYKAVIKRSDEALYAAKNSGRNRASIK